MFKHSVKVPRLYKVAAVIAKEVSDGKGSIKQLVYEKQKKHPNIKALYALVSTLYQRKSEIDRLLKRSQFLEKEPRLDIWLAKILIVELLWGRRVLPGQSKPENTIRAYEQIFKAHLSDEKPTETVISQGTFKPRYVRVNSLALTQNEAIEGFRNEGWTLSKFLDTTNYSEFLNKIASLNEDEFMVDIHIPNLLIFPPKTEFYRHPAYKNGSLILQDKASCLPVHLLAPPPGSRVLDMCAAPGMKATHAAAALSGRGTVYAVERNERRLAALEAVVASAGAACVSTVHRDVLTCGPDDFPGVEYVLVDPSCSGSGMSDRADTPQSADHQHRLKKLTGFQIKILRSALTRYPDVKRVVYSTCSLHPEENEDVVRQVLETNSRFKLVPAGPLVGGVWRNFGSPEYGDIGSFCLYARPEEDLTNGFFVAVFERLREGEENRFFNTRVFNFQRHLQAKERRRRRRFDGEEVGETVEEIDEKKKGPIERPGEQIDAEAEEEVEPTIITKKKNRRLDWDGNCNGDSIDDDPAEKKKKRKKSKRPIEWLEEQIENSNVYDEKGRNDADAVAEEKAEPTITTKKKNRRFDTNEDLINGNPPEKKKKKKNKSKGPIGHPEEGIDDSNVYDEKRKIDAASVAEERAESSIITKKKGKPSKMNEMGDSLLEAGQSGNNGIEPTNEELINGNPPEKKRKKKKKKSKGPIGHLEEEIEDFDVVYDKNRKIDADDVKEEKVEPAIITKKKKSKVVEVNLTDEVKSKKKQKHLESEGADEHDVPKKKKKKKHNVD